MGVLLWVKPRKGNSCEVEWEGKTGSCLLRTRLGVCSLSMFLCLVWAARRNERARQTVVEMRDGILRVGPRGTIVRSG